MAAVADATAENFRDLVAEGTVLVDVWGPACAPCVALSPHVEAIAEERPDLRVLKLEAPNARRLCMELKIMGMPAFLLFRDGEETARLHDPQLTADKLRAWLGDQLDTDDPQQE